ncbi:MAG: DUF2461 domain-containing protein [Bacteroidales bacterium]|jgi:uncharacterized protein (TIGR02453 family)|nr:DUF2461 domain-containing protein [Bacteroidales bacterium]
MSKIDKSVMEFLGSLAANNSKEWFDGNRSWYADARRSFEVFVQELIDGTVEFEPVLKGLEAKSCIYRINRDIRFSNDKTPYKTNFGALIMKGGRKNFTRHPGYYIHVEPGKSFISGGAYMPPPDMLAAIRMRISEQPEELLEIINSSGFRKYFSKIEGSRLKKAPKGFDPAHKHIELLKFKDYYVDIHVPDSRITEPGYMHYVLDVFREIKPFHDFIDSSCD